MALHDVTLKDVFDKILGPEKADQFAKDIDEGFEKGLTGQQLHDHVSTVWGKHSKGQADEAHNQAGCIIVVVR